MPATLSMDGMKEKRKSPGVEGKGGLSGSGGLWWLPEAVAELLTHGGPWPKMGPMGFLAKRVSMRVLGNSGSKEMVGPIVVLGPRWLAPFGLIGLGQKGPKWPTDCTDCRPRAVGAVGGLNGPKRPFRPKPH
ncbi:hypothetical protein O181_087183 [Austropuccinia psidii MF-1]|uniref:Uncharacterized protein n=1 Tax=Austropuccinia psidii MF-1 TaxID=1389203 RepID=A0A9Q3IP71_9BASI|nr:hypothetical protein [Austropuccinia psidii MF-1]